MTAGTYCKQFYGLSTFSVSRKMSLHGNGKVYEMFCRLQLHFPKGCPDLHGVRGYQLYDILNNS
jgi:hypothetical protein